MFSIRKESFTFKISLVKLYRSISIKNNKFCSFFYVIPLIAIASGSFVLINQLLFAGPKSTIMSLGGVIITLIGLPIYLYMNKKNAKSDDKIKKTA